ncbi:hypothetical protein Tco_0637920 [Tanacetum coccineum]
MTGLNFIDLHNMVAYLEKSMENADFAEIVDFLNANPIRYAFIVSPTIYVSYIEQFWSTAKIKTVNNETQIHAKIQALVDKKKVIITETSVRSDLQLEDAEDETVTKEWEDRMERATTIASSLEVERDSGMNLFKIGTSRRRSLGEEDASKQESNLKQGKQIFEESDFDDEGFDADIHHAIKDVEGDAEQVISAAADEVSTSDAVNTAGTKVNTASAPVTNAGISVTTAEPSTPPPTTTTIIEDEDIAIAQTLVKMRSEKSKERGVVMKEPSETATRLIVPPQQHDLKDKVQLQAELEEEERLAKQREEDANIAEWDDVQAIMDADYELAARLQAEEQGELTIEEKSRLFV